MKILIADDSRVMRQIVKRTLRQAGFTGHTVLEAGDGSEALALVLAERPDLVLADWNMPGLSGLEVLQQVRSHGITVPYGFVTSEASDRMRELAIAAGATFVITKPFTDVSFQDALSPLGV